MIFINEHARKIDELYRKLQELRQGKRILESAMHNCFYNKTVYNRLFDKLDIQNQKIKEVKKELAKEKRDYEKSRKDI